MALSHAHVSDNMSPLGFGRAFGIGITLNMTFMVIEALFGRRASG
jgi:hypothetical protein